jgi:hypothetical protein
LFSRDGFTWGIFWVKSEAINQHENKVFGLYDHIGNFVLTCLAPLACTVPFIMMHPASVDGQALLYDQPLFSNSALVQQL